MASYSSRELFIKAPLKTRLILKFRAGIRKLKLWFSHLSITPAIRKLAFLFGEEKYPEPDDNQIDSHISQSDIFHEQARKIQLAYSVTTCLKPVNFDLSMFFVTSPPVLPRV